MGTAKRERQKANKARREQELIQSANRTRTVRIVVIVVGAIVAVFGLVLLAGQFIGDDDDPSGADLAALDTIDDGADAEVTPDASILDAPADDTSVTEPAADTAAEPVAVPEVSVSDAEVVPEGCPPIGGTNDQTQTFAEPPPMCLDPDIDYRAVVTTNLGVIEVDLNSEAAPKTVNSFVFLARNNYFNDTVCHRVIQEFVVQCGDPTASGSGGPGYTIDDELPEGGQYEVGSFAMANSGPDTQGSQFFIISGPDGAALPPAYSLFGDVADDDLDVVTEMNARGSLDSSGTPSAPVELVDVQIATA